MTAQVMMGRNSETPSVPARSAAIGFLSRTGNAKKAMTGIVCRPRPKESDERGFAYGLKRTQSISIWLPLLMLT